MTATDELRRMLDERGVEHEGGGRSLRWRDRYGIMMQAFPLANGELGMGVWSCTPEQAIDATLGRGECRLDGYTDAMFRVCSGPEDTDFIDYAEVCECSACGASVIVPHEYERVTADSDELWPKFNFCPNCGRRIEVDDG